MRFEKVVYEKEGRSFAVLDGERRSIIVWSVAKVKGGVELIHFSLRPDGLVHYESLGKFTARVAEGEAVEILCGGFRSEQDFQTKQKEGLGKKTTAPDA